MSTQPPAPSESEKDALIDKLLAQSHKDLILGVYSPRYFHELLRIEAARAQRYKLPLSLLIGQVDQIRQLHTTLGYGSGIKVHKAFAEFIRSAVRVTDYVCRAHGVGKVAIILTHTELNAASHVGEKLKHQLAEKLRLPDELRGIEVSVTFGVGQYQPRESSDSLITRVD